MRILLSALGTLLFIICGHAAEPPPGFLPLFNGEDLSGWRGGQTYDHRALLALPEAERAAKIAEWTASLTKINPETEKPHWRAENGMIANDGQGDFLTTERDYDDFELLLDYRVEEHTDSGVYLRGVPQVQIWNPHEEDPEGWGKGKGSGGLWNNPAGAPGKDPLRVADNLPGEWNHLRIRIIGDRVSVWLNDQYVVDHAIMANYHDRTLPVAEQRRIPERGPIQLQTHGGRVDWRNLFIREIGAVEAAQIAARSSGMVSGRGGDAPLAPKGMIDGTEPGWSELREGDFENVNCAEDTWTWKANILHCTGKPIGVMRTEERHKNFELVLEWRHMESGGNSGVFAWASAEALAGIKPGDLPKGGIEVQILDHGYHKVYERNKGKPGTFFSTDGDVFAVGTSKMKPFPPLSPNGERSFPRLNRTRGVGEWNHYYVRGINGEIRLWVNGVEVSGGADCDPREGFLCLESEGSPVEFRGIRIRRLP